jgi:hypothetical protein
MRPIFNPLFLKELIFLSHKKQCKMQRKMQKKKCNLRKKSPNLRGADFWFLHRPKETKFLQKKVGIKPQRF